MNEPRRDAVRDELSKYNITILPHVKPFLVRAYYTRPSSWPCLQTTGYHISLACGPVTSGALPRELEI
jgi:hypothetical protein